MKNKVLLTGAGGFVGRVLRQQLIDEGYTVCNTTHGPNLVKNKEHYLLDICDKTAVEKIVKEIQPTHIVHLAAITHVPTSFKKPIATWQANVIGTINLLEAVRAHSPEAFVLFVSSSEVYGESFKAGMALNEETVCHPMNPYAASKLAAELAVNQYFRQGIKGVIARPFNHIGPGQSPDFVTASFAKQIAEIEKGIQPPVIKVGNLDSYRDFLDVRDVCSAYVKLLATPVQPLAKRVVNIASGQPRCISEILETLLKLSEAVISVEQDLERLRPSDIPFAAGDSALIKSLTGWQPVFSLNETLLALLNDFRASV